MKKIILICALLFITNSVLNAQVTLCLGQDATVCAGQTVQITNCSGGGPILGAGITLDNATTLPQLSDDEFSGLIPMGFSFNFYGTNYTNCVIGSNGLISFNAGNANSGCPWSLVGMGTLPNTTLTTARNSAMLFYSDINPSQAPIGPIKYQTIGTAPNRKFVVLFESVNAFQCQNTCYYGAIVFYETSNLIDMMIGQKPNCASWNGGLAIQGVENAAGTVATITPGRNNSVWNANQDGKRFTPIAPNNTSNYAVATVQYYTVTSTSNNSIQWASTSGGLFPYNNGVLNITTVPPGTTGYYLTATACNAAVGGVSDTSFITRQVVTGTATATTDYCFGGVGTATINPTQGSAPFTFTWSPGGQTTQTATNLVSGPYTVHIIDSMGCSANVNVNVPNTNATFSGSSTLVSCPGGNDGTATATMTPPLGVVSYNWYDAGGQTAQTATGLTAGIYHCIVSTSQSSGCTDTVEVIVSEIPGMISTIINQSDVTCNSGNDGMIEVSVVDGTAPYTYSWGSSSSSTGPSANDLFAGTHTVTITDANNCVITTTTTIGEPTALKITSLTPDTVICPEASIVLNVQGTGGNGSAYYTFTWKENGTVIGTGTSITVDPAATATQYCVELTEQCGSPSTDSCMTISFPTAIVPSYVSNLPYSCLPGAFIFINQSNNSAEIDSVVVDFGNGDMGVFYGDSDLTYTYTSAGIYTISVVTTSIQGCVTTNTFPGIANVIANPVADFSMSANPTTIFETVVKMQDKSSPNVVSWTWTSVGSNPNNSTYQNPTFHYPEGVVATYVIQLIVETPEGCRDTVERILSVNSDIIFYAPNAFTPDGDEFNQTWKFYVSGIDEYNFELMIFNRWGEVIWETHDPNAAWDGTYNGKVVPAGAYSWIARVKDLYTDSKKTFNGAINILR